ncbi:MAG: pimeloyl-ACP methyl ester esterase BioH [Gammaproteobacteria bacterium SHHR-1]|uniref:pimeloyl-ACP methyl ester esterase BioH n=1 Tax=Magnetovirga frankeli TaxID=947516 RepID=UPI001293B3BB|nr:pimeloyl-ACP methyl ester esterase BioH [gamma proteobacterium SS-5]
MQDLFLIHGWGMNAAVWAPLLGPLSGRFRLHLAELPGHGRQPYADQQDPSQWACALLEQAPQRAIWLGWSLGGQLALQAAMQAPQRLQRLLLTASTPLFVRAGDWPSAMPEGTLGQFAQALEQDYLGTLGRFLALQVRGSAQAKAVLRQLREGLSQRPAADPRALAAGLALLRGADLRPALTALNCPLHFCFGERDSLIPIALADDLAALCPAARVRRIAGAGHAPFLSHPDDWLDWVWEACP